MFVSDMFTLFKKETLAEIKDTKLYNEAIETYSTTELFDLRAVAQLDRNFLIMPDKINMPFKSTFSHIKISNNDDQLQVFILMNEYDMQHITGTVLFRADGVYLKIPYTFCTKERNTTVEYPPGFTEDLKQLYFKAVVRSIALTALTFNDISKVNIILDKPTKDTYEYYRYKGSRRKEKALKVKVPYTIILTDRKNTANIPHKGSLVYDFSFPVRGHWMRIKEGSTGKDRQGLKINTNYTWRNSHIRGQGELKRKIKVVK